MSQSNYGTSVSNTPIGKQPLNCLDGTVGKPKLNQNLHKLIVFITGGEGGFIACGWWRPVYGPF